MKAETKGTGYTTLTGNSPDKLDRSVNRYIKEGWQLFGTPYGIYDGRRPLYCQAMIIAYEETPDIRTASKRAEEDKNWPSSVFPDGPPAMPKDTFARSRK